MIESYLKIAVRYSLKDGNYSTIKISGLVIGIAAIIVISISVFPYIIWEISYSIDLGKSSYDRFGEAQRITSLSSFFRFMPLERTGNKKLVLRPSRTCSGECNYENR